MTVERPAEAVDEQMVTRLGLAPRIGPLGNELYRYVKQDGAERSWVRCRA